MDMRKFAGATIAGALLASSSFAVLSQDSQPYVLRVDGGKIMVSTGGDFAVAQTGQALADGNRVTVCEGAAAVVDYGSGCSVQYTQPGCYIVQRSTACLAGAMPSSSMGGMKAAAVVAGLAAIAGVILANGDDNDAIPVSR